MRLFVTRSVTVKLLPFDNKSELAVVIDLPEGATLEDTERTLFSIAGAARQLPEIRSIETYAGTPAPFNFNGLVRHYYFRELPELGELHLNLAPRDDRDRIEPRHRARSARAPEEGGLAGRHGRPRGRSAAGPAGAGDAAGRSLRPDSTSRRAVAHELKKIFASVPYIVDIDDSIGQPRPRLRISIDQDRLEFFGVEQRDVYDTIAALFGGTTVGYSHRGEGRNPIEIVVRLPKRDLSWSELLASTPVPANSVPGNKTVVELGDVVRVSQEVGSPTIFRRDGRFADMVMAELAGAYEAPIYGILDVDKKIEAHDWGALGTPAIRFHGQPDDESKPAMLWDGEWEITYVTFRDMGAAFMVAIVGIYILVVAQFGSFKLPLVVLTPIPLTLIGIVIGHLAVRRAVHRHLDDRVHRARRHHRAQFDSAGRFHPPRRRAGQNLARGAAGSRRGPLQAYPADRARRHDRRRDDSASTRFSRAWRSRCCSAWRRRPCSPCW